MPEHWEVSAIEPARTVPHRHLAGCIGIEAQVTRTFQFADKDAALRFAEGLPVECDIAVTHEVESTGASIPTWSRSPRQQVV